MDTHHWLLKFGLWPALLLASMVWSASADSPHPSDSAEATVTRLENGLGVVILSEPNEPLVKIEMFLSLEGAPRQKGLAHLVEHLMFTSSKDCPAGSLRDSLRLLTTYHNAFTSTRLIQTSSRVLPAMLPRYLAVEAQRLGHLSPTPEDFDREKSRVLGERNFRRELRSQQALFLEILDMAQGDQEDGDILMGSASDIQELTYEQALGFVEDWFHPQRASLLISGPVEPGEVLERVNELFGPQPRGAEKGFVDLLLDDDPRGVPPRIIPGPPDRDLLSVGFLFPYKTDLDKALVQFTLTTLERENAHPWLVPLSEHALILTFLAGKWSQQDGAGTGLEEAQAQFWRETRTVKQRVRDSWLLEQNREKHLDDLTRKMSRSSYLAQVQASCLAEGVELPDMDVMAALVRNLEPQQVSRFFKDFLIRERALTALAVGDYSRSPEALISRKYHRARVNPYLANRGNTSGLTYQLVRPLLDQLCLVDLGVNQLLTLDNGIPVHLLEVPGHSEFSLKGVRTFSIEGDDGGPIPSGRLWFLSWLTRQGYDQRGAKIMPDGYDLKWDTSMAIHPPSMHIETGAPIKRWEDAVREVHKRFTVHRMNPFAFTWGGQNLGEWFEGVQEQPEWEGRSWRVRTMFGPGHPVLDYYDFNVKNLESWSIEKANRLHWRLCRTGNLRLVAMGDLATTELEHVMNETFGQCRPWQEVEVSLEAQENLGVVGSISHDPGSPVAVLSFLFPPFSGEPGKAMDPVDARVLERLCENQLNAAFTRAGHDSIQTILEVESLGSSFLPELQIYCPVGDLTDIIDLTRIELAHFKQESPSLDSEARARLDVGYELVELFAQPDEALQLLVQWGQVGAIPSHPMRTLKVGGGRTLPRMASQVRRLLPAQHYAWHVLADTTRVDRSIKIELQTLP